MSAAWWSSAAIFLIHGLLVATWISRIPTIQVRMGLDNATLGLTLLGMAAGCVVAMPVCGWLVNRYGSKPVTRWSTAAFCVTLIPLAHAGDPLLLTAALFAFGASAGTMDVAMNAQGVEVETALGRPAMSRLHGMFSLGGMLGSAIGGLVAASGIAPEMHFAVTATALMVAILPSTGRMLVSAAAPSLQVQPRQRTKISARLAALCAVSFCMLLSEGAMADWTGIYLHQTFAVDLGTAAAGYAGFSAGMALFRFFGDAITERLGPVNTIRGGSLLGACGLLWATLAASAEWALPGLALTGAGFSVIVPIVFSAGGRLEDTRPGTGIAMVTGIGYAGFLAGPPAIGFLSQALTLRVALGLLIVLCLACTALAWAARPTYRGRNAGPNQP